MALTVEDGTGLAAADSYISLVDARAMLALTGQDLNVADAIAEQQLIKAKDYVDSFRAKMKGHKLTREQSLQFPRRGVYIDNWLNPSDEVPTEIKQAQTFAAYEVEQGNVLQPVNSGKKIESQELDVLKISYFKNSSTESSNIFTRVIGALSPLLTNGMKLIRS